jgi:hypothetical protein
LGEKNDVLIQVKESANKMQLAMDNKELYLGQQASDDVLIGKFAALMRSIKTWSQLFPRIQIDNLKLHLKNEEMIDEVLHVFPGCPRVEDLEKVLNNPQKRRLFIRGWVGLIITKHFFRSLPDGDYPAFNRTVDLWLQERTSESVATLETVFFYAGMISACQRTALITDHIFYYRPGKETHCLYERTSRLEGLDDEPLV